MIFILFSVFVLSVLIFCLKFCGLAPFLTFRDYLFRHQQSLLRGSDIKRLNLDLDEIHKVDPVYGHWLVHPCVRYIPEGFAGHKWWMVVTPYPNSNSHYEQPVLYYGDGNEVEPPMNWKFVSIVQDPHENGFNSDPNLYYDGSRLWIFWKETKTENTLESANWHSIMARFFDGYSWGPVQKMADNNDPHIANVFAPTILNLEGNIVMLATAFEHPRVEGSQLPFGHNHLALWRLDSKEIECGHFVFERVCKQSYLEDFNFWHADICQISENSYCCVVTDEQAKRLLIGTSENGLEFEFNDSPLLSSYGNNVGYIYKASPVFVNGGLYVFYPLRTGLLKKNRKVDIYYSKVNQNIIENNQ